MSSGAILIVKTLFAFAAIDGPTSWHVLGFRAVAGRLVFNLPVVSSSAAIFPITYRKITIIADA
jgi:hypothetical protein